MELIDSHCHLNHPLLATQVEKILADAREVGVNGYIIPGVVASQFEDILKLCTTDDRLHCAAGLHPLFLHEHSNQDLVILENICRQQRPVALGEIGLDYYHGREQQQAQQLLFEQQLDIAIGAKLPIILHVRKAHDDILATLRRKRFTGGGSVHAFNGSLQQAQQYISMGFVIGIGGAITHERARKLRTMVEQLPVDSMILETDSPDMLVSGKKKSSPNLPQYLPEILDALAGLKQMPPERLAEITQTTTQNTFHIGLP